MDIRGKHALVTGSAKRLGRAIAERLLHEGASLTAHYHRSSNEATELEVWAKGRGFSIQLVQADLSTVEGAQALAEKAREGLGPVDLLINSASDFYPTPTAKCTEANWDELMAVNAKGPFFLCQAVGKTMVNSGGVIINIADVNATRPMRGYAPYLASKASLLMVTRALALEWAPRVRVNAVSPGAVLLPENYTEEQRVRSIQQTLLGRLGDKQDIVEGVLFLIRNEYITGFDLKIDGGRVLTAYPAKNSATVA